MVIRLALFFSLFFGVIQTSSALEFSIQDRWINATGIVQPSSGKDLRKLMTAQPRDENGFHAILGVKFESPGGSLIGGIELGMVLVDFNLRSRVESGNVCASACALAFLGGTFPGATSVAPGRELESGAFLGLHGFTLDSNVRAYVQDTISNTQIINGIILDYAAHLGNIDLGWLARTQAITTDQMAWVNTIAGMQALAIDISDEIISGTDSSNRQVCKSAIEEVTDLGSFPNRVDRLVSREFEVIESPRNLISYLNNVAFRGEIYSGIRQEIDKLPEDKAFGVIGVPEVVSENSLTSFFRLERGGGFYFSACVSSITFDLNENRVESAFAVLIDPLSGYLKVVKLGNYGHVPRNEELW